MKDEPFTRHFVLSTKLPGAGKGMVSEMNKEQLEELLHKLTLDEKIGMIHGNELFATKGVERLQIPPFKTSDGPMGCRKEHHPTEWIPVGQSFDYTSYLPSNTALAATWNPDLAYETGRILGNEARGRGKDMILAPGVNIMRSPLCGRNFEYMGEDPYLAGEMVVPLVKGIEENDVSSCVKHFALNNQETRRLDVDVEVSERALREIYLPAFKKAVTEGKAKGIMGAYNKFRGQHCCHNEYLLKDILREEWGFKGITVSDWGGVHSTEEAAYNGLDIEMSVTNDFDSYYMADPLKKAVQAGEIPECLIDEKVSHILYVMNENHMLDGERIHGSYNDPDDRRKLRRAAEESVVLLKNEEGLLPLDASKIKKLALIGDNADRIHADGGGSAEIKALYEISPSLGIHMLLGGDVEIVCEPGFYNEVKGTVWEDADQSKSLRTAPDLQEEREAKQKALEEKNREYRARALKAAETADVVIYIGGLNHDFDVEDADRKDIVLPYSQDQLIEELLSVRKDMIVVMMSGAPVAMGAWKDKTATILQTWYAGMEGGYALAEILFGIVTPSGKLPMTIPYELKDCSAHCMGEFPGGDKVCYKEDVFVGYRYFDTYQVETAFPFGYGLSYTRFTVDSLNVEVKEDNDTLEAEISVTIVNVGEVPGAETVQVYIGDDEASVHRPVKELKAFRKVVLQPGEGKRITMNLPAESFAFYDEEREGFLAEAGSFHIMVGDCSDNLILEKKIVLEYDHFLGK